MMNLNVEPETGWVVWHWEDQLFLLGWLRDGQQIRGVEVETSALLSRIAAGFAERPSAGLTFAILDGNGQIFSQHGETEATAKMKPLVAASLAPQLPHWQVAIYGAPPAAARRSFLLVSVLLVGVFVIAILSGGSLLMWQARRNMVEAQQRTSFVANVSHELKTPLTTIRMYSEMMAEGRVTAEEKRRSYLETITRETQRLTRLINNVLDFSRLEQGKKKYQTERLDIAAVTREVLDSQADRLREAGLVLTTDLPDEPCFAKLDRDALAQCLLNLVDNAIKYAATGCKLTVQLRKADTNWRLVVEDAGTGVPTAHCAKLFEQFHRADDSLTAKVAGFGLGLSISRRLLRDQGGELLYERAESGGARFIMVLPGDAT
jgi:signal transduction histidine kinase